MAADPRTFLVKQCFPTSKQKANDATERRDFFNSIGKIGDIEALNSIGASNISEGLRVLAKTSNSIRTGDTSSAIIQGGDANGKNAVLTEVGINPNEAENAGKFNPGVLNRAQGQAQVIYDQVKQGQYTLKDIPNGIQDLQNLDQLIKGIFTDSSSISSTRDLVKCGASPYATDLISYAPKYKFLFVVQIEMKDPYSSLKPSGNVLAFVVKSSTRPNVNIEHEEINMYNFWTRVPKRVEFEPITMRFYDDNKGFAHRFYKKYLNAISPITNLGGSGSAGNATNLLSPEYLQNIGMNALNGASSASLGSLNRNVTTLIDQIKVFHVYDYGRQLSIYHYHHPKILSMNLDELDMAENGGGNEIELQFAFDALNITQDIKMDVLSSKLEGITDFGLYPLKGSFDDSAPIDAFDEDDGSEGDDQSGPTSTSGLVSNAFNSVTNFVGSIFDSPGGGDADYGTND